MAQALKEVETSFTVWFEKNGKLESLTGFDLYDGRDKCEKLFKEKEVTLVALIGPEGRDLRWTKD